MIILYVYLQLVGSFEQVHEELGGVDTQRVAVLLH